MGNACCSENGGQSHDDEMKNYDSRQGRPVNQSADGKLNFGHMPDTGYPQGPIDDNLLLAYTSGD
jgi:hypothetical protein